MITVTNDFKVHVLDDLKTYESIYRPVKASPVERLLINSLPIHMLHPNPEDEFCHLDVGPNYEIVRNYADQILIAQHQGNPLFEDSLVCMKISTGGYMLLNGHHRWLAAYQSGIKRLPVQIVNVIQDEEILSKLNASNRQMCVSFDLDEVLLTDGRYVPADRKIPLSLRSLYHQSLRKNAPALIRFLQNRGFDVWIYTSQCHSEDYINFLFRLHHVKVDGIVNNLAKKKNRGQIRQSFSKKYRYSLHIDNESLICVDTVSKDYSIHEVSPDVASWASDMAKTVKGIKFNGTKS